MQRAEEILNPKAIRVSTKKILDYTIGNQGFFNLNLDRLHSCADLVVQVIKENYPKLIIPFHSRWGHFKVGHVNRVEDLLKKFSSDPFEQARIKFDLVMTSVLLDAGSGPDWTFKEYDMIYNKSEGLAIASFHMFKDGGFSNEDSNPFKADGKKLSNLKKEELESFFQVSSQNPLVGVQGRVLLLNQLGYVLENSPKYFPSARPGSLVDFIFKNYNTQIDASDLLIIILTALGPIWPGRIKLQGINLGDVWNHEGTKELIVFHKLSQWLTYSLIEPLEEVGIRVLNLNHLTGLAEYRNGGLFVDTNVIELKNKSLYNVDHSPSSDLIIEWRALTVQMLDKIAPIVCLKLGINIEDFPLVKLLEGGTWHAGRKIAKKLRSDGSSPIKIKSDGTVF